MTLIRTIVDVEVEDYPSDRDLEKVNDAIESYVHGTVATTVVRGDKNVGHGRTAHVHESSRSDACNACYQHATDLLK